MASYFDLATEIDEFLGDLLHCYGMGAYAEAETDVVGFLAGGADERQALIDTLSASATMAVINGNLNLAKRGYELADKLRYEEAHKRIEAYAPWDRPSPLDGKAGTPIVGLAALGSRDFGIEASR